MMSGEPLHVKTPIRDSMALSKMAGTSVYLKMDSAQPSGSFKIRGIGHFCKRGRPRFHRERAEGGTVGKAGGHRAISGRRGPAVWSGPGAAGGGLGGR
ncbi:SDS isoform 6, partial [Pongo abelii]